MLQGGCFCACVAACRSCCAAAAIVATGIAAGRAGAWRAMRLGARALAGTNARDVAGLHTRSGQADGANVAVLAVMPPRVAASNRT